MEVMFNWLLMEELSLEYTKVRCKFDLQKQTGGCLFVLEAAERLSPGVSSVWA